MLPHTLIVTISIFVQPPVSTNMNPLDARAPEYRTEYVIQHFNSRKKCEEALKEHEAPGRYAAAGGLNGVVTAGGQCVPGKINRSLI